MIDINHLAQLTGLELTPEEVKKFGPQLESVIELLEKVKNFEVQESDQSWYELLDLHTKATNKLVPDSTPKKLLTNIKHPLVGQALEVSKFVE